MRCAKNMLRELAIDGIPANRRPLWPWLSSSAAHAAARILLNFFPRNLRMLSLVSNKRSFLLLQQIKKISGKPGLVVAHNPGSLPGNDIC